MGLAEEDSHYAAGHPLDDPGELFRHMLLKAPTDVLDGVLLAALDERPLRFREAFLQHDYHEVVDDVGPSPCRPLAVEGAVEANELTSDLGPHLTERPFTAALHSRPEIVDSGDRL